MIFTNKKGDLLGDMFVVIITLVVFFSFYPVLDVMIQVALEANAEASSSVVFMIQSITFIVLFGVIKWVLNRVGGGASE